MRTLGTMPVRADRGAQRLAAFAAVATLLALAGAAHAQAVLTGGFPSPWANPFAGLDDPTVRIATGNVMNPTGSRTTSGGQRGALRLRGAATVTEDGDATRDRFSYTLGGNQNFQVSDANGANLWTPLFLRGVVNFFQNAAAPNANFAVGSITGTAEYLIWNGASYVSANDASLAAGMRQAAPLRVTLSLNSDAQVNAAGGNTDALSILQFNNAPAAMYQLQIRLTVTGEADRNFLRNSNVGSGVTTSTLGINANDLYSGLIGSLGYAPARALPNSRADVGAVEARTTYGVDGTGSRIGILEPGRVIDTPTAFAGGKVTQLRQRLDQPAGLTNPADPDTLVADGRSEHTTAVAGIAAGAAGDDSQKGVAPGAGIISVPTAAFADGGGKTAFQNQMDAMITAGATVLNMSAFSNNLPATYVDQQMLAHNLVTFVKSAGNRGNAAAGNNTITNPGMAYNIITVGALNQDMTRPATFSSNNNTDGTLRKPDIMAPGDYITAPMAIDTNGDGQVNDFDNRFTGSDARYADSEATTGGIRGTSFAAPHVSGAVALMQDYARQHAATFDGQSIDNRVIKAVLLNTAERDTVFHSDGGAWTQMSPNPFAVTGRRITESLDRQLGSGALDVNAALHNYSAGEIRLADNNTDQNFKIFAPGPNNRPIFSASSPRSEFWDLERVQAATLGPTVVNGTVDYMLGANIQTNFVAETGQFIGTVTPNFSFLRSALTWNITTNAAGDTYNPLAHLELRLYCDGLNIGNTPGFDPTAPDADTLIVTTDNAAENTKIIDYTPTAALSFSVNLGTVLPLNWDPQFYLEVVNLSNDSGPVDYGISVTVPTPSGVSVVVVAWAVAARRRRPSGASNA